MTPRPTSATRAIARAAATVAALAAAACDERAASPVDAPPLDARPSDGAPPLDAPPDAPPPLDAPPDARPSDGAPNAAPTVEPIAGPAALLAGDTGSFAVVATDPEGDALTYAWSATGAPAPGTWLAGAAATARWFSGDVAAAGDAVITVAVSDGINPPVERSITVAIAVPQFVRDLVPTFEPCASSCHGLSGGLSLTATAAYASLVGVPATAAACGSLVRVAPGAPDASVLVRKISGTSCGNRMPFGDPLYFDRNPGLVVRIRSWILAGAPPG